MSLKWFLAGEHLQHLQPLLDGEDDLDAFKAHGDLADELRDIVCDDDSES